MTQMLLKLIPDHEDNISKLSKKNRGNDESYTL